MFDDTFICCGSILSLVEIFKAGLIFFSLVHILIYPNHTVFKIFKSKIKLNFNIHE